MSLDVRHTNDEVRARAVKRLLDSRAADRGAARAWRRQSELRLDQAAVADGCAADRDAGAALCGRAGIADHRMPSGAGHDAMIMAEQMPAAMLFLRSPGGISHHPDESVLEARRRGGARRRAVHFLEQLERAHG